MHANQTGSGLCLHNVVCLATQVCRVNNNNTLVHLVPFNILTTISLQYGKQKEHRRPESLMECITTQFAEQTKKFHSKLDTLTTKYDEILKEMHETRDSHHSRISALEKSQSAVER